LTFDFKHAETTLRIRRLEARCHGAFPPLGSHVDLPPEVDAAIMDAKAYLVDADRLVSRMLELACEGEPVQLSWLGSVADARTRFDAALPLAGDEPLFERNGGELLAFLEEAAQALREWSASRT